MWQKNTRMTDFAEQRPSESARLCSKAFDALVAPSVGGKERDYGNSNSANAINSVGE